MKSKICMLLILGLVLAFFSKAEAAITWNYDNFDYNATDTGNYVNWFLGPIALNASSDMSQANSNSENSDIAAALEPQQGVTAQGLSMASAAWGNSFQDLTRDSGGATVYAYANNSFALDNGLGVFLSGQSVTSYIDRYFVVDSNQTYTLSASAAAPLAWGGSVTGTATAPQPQLTGWVYVFQTDGNGITTMLQSFSLSTLLGSPQKAQLSLVSGDLYQLVVALCNVDTLGNESNPAGIVTSFNNLDSSSLYNSLGNIDGVFNAGAQASPITVTASLAPYIVVNGACGGSNNGTFTTPPASDLCGAGAASSVTDNGSGSWVWTCAGQNGGSTASCSATIPPAPVDGACGTSNGGQFASAPTSNLCADGAASTVSQNGTWNWTCAGLNGGSTASCSATIPPAPIDGACGASNGGLFISAPTSDLCSGGAPSTVSGTGPWNWTCAGLNGGANASCSASVAATDYLWQTATPTGNDWYSLNWFGPFYTSSVNPPTWIYDLALGWLYPVGNSTDNIWFYDPQWNNGAGSWWWTSSSTFPWVYSADSANSGWYYYDAADSTLSARWFCNSSGCREY